MLEPETPSISEDILLNADNDQKIEDEKTFAIISNKNNSFNIVLQKYTNYIEIIGYSINNLINSKYEKKYYLNELKKNKYLSLCDSIDEIYEQIIFELDKNKTNIIENDNKINIIIQVNHIKVKEITLILEEKIKTEKELINDLYTELKIVKNDNKNIKEEINKIKNDFDLLKNENKKLYDKNLYLEEQLKIFSDKLNILYNNQVGLMPDKKEKKLKNEININKEKEFNNIIYYNENINDLKNIYNDSDIFENNTNGAFILCLNLDSLKLVIKEIINENKKDKKILFNLVLGEINIQNIQNLLNENNEFKECIQNICIYSKNPEKYLNITSIKILDIYKNREDIINFIITFSSKDIKPFPQIKLITYKDYLDKYKIFHYKISQFYGDLSPETYKKYFERLKKVIEEEEKEKKLHKEKDKLLEAFSKFDLKEDIQLVDKLIIKEWTKNTFYSDFNKWLYNLNMNNFETVAYFTSRFMLSLNSYAQTNDKYCKKNEEKLYRGVKMSYINLLPYERAKGKLIILSSFISTIEDHYIAEMFSGRKNSIQLYKLNLKFSTIFYITNYYKKNFIPNGIHIADVSLYKKENECLFQPFSFYYVRDVKIDLSNYTADIYLETIGKKEILEKQIKEGKEIEYNQKDRIMQVKKE